AQLSGVLAVSFVCIAFNTASYCVFKTRHHPTSLAAAVGSILSLAALLALLVGISLFQGYPHRSETSAYLIAVQPDVPMSGLNPELWDTLRLHQTQAALDAKRLHDQQPGTGQDTPTTVVLPESPMNFMWGEDPEFQQFIKQFAAKNNVSVLFNSAEPDAESKKYFNSAVMISPEGREVAEYDKIYLLPFGEAVPVPFESFIPGFVGNFSYGKNYNLVPLGDAKAGIMICFESHFGELSREYVRRGADAIIEM